MRTVWDVGASPSQKRTPTPQHTVQRCHTSPRQKRSTSTSDTSETHEHIRVKHMRTVWDVGASPSQKRTPTPQHTVQRCHTTPAKRGAPAHQSTNRNMRTHKSIMNRKCAAARSGRQSGDGAGSRTNRDTTRNEHKRIAQRVGA